MNVAPTVVWLTLGTLACGEDPVLKAAREEAVASSTKQEERTRGSGQEAPGRSRGHPMDGGAPAGSAAPPPGGAGGAGVAEEPTPGVPDEPAPAPEGSPGGGASGDSELGAGVPGAQVPGRPEEPLPGRPEEPGTAGRRPPPMEGPTVTLSGVVAYDGFSGGLLRVDIFDGDHLRQGAKRPSVVAMVQLDRPGPFTVDVPQSAGLVWVSAFNDADRNDRPGPLDPTGYYDGNPVKTDRGDQDHLTVRLIARAPPEDGGDDDF